MLEQSLRATGDPRCDTTDARPTEYVRRHGDVQRGRPEGTDFPDAKFGDSAPARAHRFGARGAYPSGRGTR
ncbi:hypothetical protein Sme01_00860 [Sphaerisporangium melleum]|uniref:Uncharacterized protein n=1 Tax=Sphaerisporangium melleum TaxID=321316 RepID=A0A917RJP7_9ACTN|nr:hypothetical protein GCM10007964_60080 [Sphaerisporangium melleum]GII67610.1 hypothetical protein Sme01_00860 [Sphaerisporangium melleum]